MGFLLMLVACTSGPDTDTDASVLPDVYHVEYEVDPAPAQAGETTTLRLQVLRGSEPVDDLQQTHERMVHTLAISRDLQSFQHLHQEDFEAITTDDLRQASFHFPVVFPAAGDTLLAFDYAAENQYLRSTGWLTVEGEPQQLAEPILDLVDVATDRDVIGTLAWDVAPVAGSEAAFHVSLTDADGAPIGDVVQWLGADAHAAMVSSDLQYVGHSHAYVQGMENAPPTHEMPHLYDGPDIPVRATFATSGTWKLWFQFAREGAPDEPYTLPFVFEVE